MSDRTPELNKALLDAQRRGDHHTESRLLYAMFPKRESSGRQHQKRPLATRLLDGCVFGATECWHWCRSRTRHGYARITYSGRMQLVHRLSWMAFRGFIPDGLSVLHKCDNRACINPDHLWLGTYSDNMRDCWTKGRRGKKK